MSITWSDNSEQIAASSSETDIKTHPLIIIGMTMMTAMMNHIIQLTINMRMTRTTTLMMVMMMMVMTMTKPQMKITYQCNT